MISVIFSLQYSTYITTSPLSPIDMNAGFVFLNACYDRELLRKITIAFDDNRIDFRLDKKGTVSQARAPLSGFFEAEIFVAENDFEKANSLWIAVTDEFSTL